MISFHQFYSYLKYILKHKYYVMISCFNHRMIWRGVLHDLSKFRPSEFIPYAQYFYNKDGSKKDIRDESGYYKATGTPDIKFNFAWLLHQKRNRHHWQWWILPEDDGGIKVMSMTPEFRKEMLCDWIGAGRACGSIKSPDDDMYLETREWYKKNKCNMVLHTETRAWIETRLNIKEGDSNDK